MLIKPKTHSPPNWRQKLSLIWQSSPFYGLTLSRKTPQNLHLTPFDSWPGNPKIGCQFIDEYLNFNGTLYTISDLWKKIKDNKKSLLFA